MKKNVANQIVIVFAWDTANAVPKTGDANNITAQISKDGGAANATNDTNPTELDAVELKGLYKFELLQEETNCDVFTLSPVSGTADIDLEPVIIHTTEEAAIKAKTDNIPASPAPASEYDTEMGRIDQSISGTQTSIVAEINDNEDKIDTLTTNVGNLNNVSTAQVETACGNALDTYDPPTRDELTSDKDEIIAEVNGNETKIDSLQSDVTGIKSKTDNLPADTESEIDRILGLLHNNTVWEFTYTDDNQTSGKIYLYDNAAHTTAHDGVTGLIGKYIATITVVDGKPTVMKIIKDS